MTQSAATIELHENRAVVSINIIGSNPNEITELENKVVKFSLNHNAQLHLWDSQIRGVKSSVGGRVIFHKTCDFKNASNQLMALLNG